MDYLQGAHETGYVWLGFDRQVRLEFQGSKISSDGISKLLEILRRASPGM